jgi:DNA repair exonuclease SbcCD ATPase subunit
MAETDPYQAWLDEFKREIDTLAAKPPTNSREAGRSAQAAFSSWCQSELGSPAVESAAAKGPVVLPALGLAARLEALTQEKASLQSELELARQQYSQLRQHQEESRAAREELEVQLVRLKQAQNGAAAGLQDTIRLLEEQIQAQRQDKSFAENAFERLEVRAQALEADLRQASSKGVAAERDALEARRRLGELEPELQRLKQEAAAAQATITELRRQASSYQERVVDLQEHTGSDMSLLRQELREFLIKVKRLIDEAAGRQS